jgi:endonuclease/exonuclease/phosphatase family metal-dependent hydrolase
MLGSEEADATGGQCMKGATMKHRAVSDIRLILSIGLLSAMTIFITGCQTSTPAPSTGGYPLTVMSQNMFGESSDLTPSLTATSLPAYKAAVGEIFREVQASDAPGRATAVAHEIGVSRPDIIGLQEVFSWLTGPLGSPPATKVAYDQLQLLLGALASQGLHYAPVATLTDSDIEEPSNLGFDVRLIDHDVLLARTDLPDLTFSNIQAHHFANLLSGTIIVGKITIPRGWISADATFKGRTFRILTTHLESISATVRIAQGSELVQGPAHTNVPAIFIGDYNVAANAGDQTYQTFLTAGFTDAWHVTHPGDPGNTVPLPTPSTRADLVLLLNGVHARSMEIIGNAPADRTPLGFWPSDHAGVVATVLM